MTKRVITYIPNGTITEKHEMTDETYQIFQATPGEVSLDITSYSEDVAISDYYVNTETGTVHKKSELTEQIVVSTGQITINNTPPGTYVSCLGIQQAITESEVIEFDEPGTYIIELRCAPQYYDKEIEVDIP